jgi:hypothetical protein
MGRIALPSIEANNEGKPFCGSNICGVSYPGWVWKLSSDIQGVIMVSKDALRHLHSSSLLTRGF